MLRRVEIKEMKDMQKELSKSPVADDLVRDVIQIQTEE